MGTLTTGIQVESHGGPSCRMSPVTLCALPAVTAVYDVTLNFRGNKNPSLLGILYGKKYEADMCVRSATATGRGWRGRGRDRVSVHLLRGSSPLPDAPTWRCWGIPPSRTRAWWGPYRAKEAA